MFTLVFNSRKAIGMTFDLHSLSPEQKALLIKNLNKQPASSINKGFIKKNAEENAITMESRSLLSCIACNEIPSIASATLSYFPVEIIFFNL